MDDPREPLGRIVRETWVAWAKEQSSPKPSWLLGWEDLDDGQREVDMRIASAVAVQAVADAKLRNERLEMQVFALGAITPALRRALVIAITDAEWESEKRDYRKALEVLGGEERDGSWLTPGSR